MFEIIGLLVIQVFLLALSSVGGVLCVVFVYFFTLRVGASNRKRVALGTAFLFPFVAVFYIEAGLFLHDTVRYVSGRDSLVDGLYHYSLVNGYQLVFFNESAPDGGWLELPGGRSFPGGRIYGVQVAGDYLFMHASPDESRGETPTVTVGHGNLPPPSPRADRYLEVDTRSSDVVDHATLENLRIAAAKRGVALSLMPLDDAYGKAVSAASPGWAFLGLLFLPLIAASVWLFRRLLELRRMAVD